MDIVEKLKSQLGDDVRLVFDRQALFRLAAEEIETLRHAVAHEGERIDRARAHIARLEAENRRLREALGFIAEEGDAGRGDGLPEACPAHDDVTMWAAARAALGADEAE